MKYANFQSNIFDSNHIKSVKARGLGAITLTAALAFSMTGCGGGSTAPRQGLAAQSQAVVASVNPGATPFISLVQVQSNFTNSISSIEFNITPKPGSLSKAVDVTYNSDYLFGKNYLVPANNTVSIPVFGLYSNTANAVTLTLTFTDDSVQTIPLLITTAPYVDPSGIYDHPTIFTQRVPGSTLGFDFFYMKSNMGTPVVMDSDCEVRWVGAGVTNSFASILLNNQFIVGDLTGSAIVNTVNFDGSSGSAALIAPTVTSFNHNFDFGKQGILAEANTKIGNENNVESTIIELTPSGTLLATWDMGQILSSYMTSQGDDPTKFIYPGKDWFHSNSAIYDPSDDSLIVSSRESFVIKVDYRTGNIIWIFGDPTKYWHTFKSLAAKSLTLANASQGGLYPIGQHGLSINAAGNLVLFNDGMNSLSQPAGAPTGMKRNYSAASCYSIDPAAGTATEISHYDHGQDIFSPYCGSVAEAADQSLLIDYATAENQTAARIIAVDPAGNVAFDLQFKDTGCNASWNAQFINLQSMVFGNSK